MTKFEELKQFIIKEMRTSYIYRPVMLIDLLKNNGKRKVTDIAKAFVNRYPTQVEYYSSIFKNMVGELLTNNRGMYFSDLRRHLIMSINEFFKGFFNESFL